MNFTELDFHISTRNGEEPLRISRPFRMRTNYNPGLVFAENSEGDQDGSDYYDVVVRDAKSLDEIHRHRVETMECLLPVFRGIGFAKLRWDASDVVALSKSNKEVFRFSAETIRQTRATPAAVRRRRSVRGSGTRGKL